MHEILRLFRLASPFKYWMLLSVALGFFTIGSSVGLLMTAAYIISAAALHPSIAELQVAVVGVRFFGISRGVFRYFERLIAHNTTFRILARLRVWFFQALLPLAPARLMYFKSPDLLARIVSDVQSLEQFFVRVIAPPAVAVLTSALIWFLFGFFNPLFSVLLLVFHGLAGLVVPFMTYHFTKGMGKKIINIRAELNNQFTDGIQGLADLALFGQSGNHFKKLEQLQDQYSRLINKKSLILSLHETFIGLLMNGAVLTILILAIPMVTHSTLHGVYLAVIVMGVMASFEAVLPLPEAMHALESSSKAASRLFEIIDAKPTVKEPKKPAPVPRNNEIRYENVAFTYPGNNENALFDISFIASPGSKTAIVGPSGAGKSTLSNLLLRFWDYKNGRILIGNNEIKSFAQTEITKSIGLVSQQTYLFNGTIRENLQLAQPGAGDDAIKSALQMAQFDSGMLAERGGLDTPVGEHGLQLSGGERQRLAIARVLLREIPILLLDEATANLDALTEQNFLNTLWEISKNKTLIMLTHRLVGMEKMDQIIVMYSGRIIEKGTHAELIQHAGFYFKMYRLQQQTIS